MAGQTSLSPTLAFLLGAAVVGLGVLSFLLYQRTRHDVVKIDAPGFSGGISKDQGVDIEIGKQR